MRVERKRGSWGRGIRNTSRHECVRIGEGVEVSRLSVSHTYDVGVSRDVSHGAKESPLFSCFDK